MEREPYYYIASLNFEDALKSLGPMPAQSNPLMAHLIEGLRHLALGLQQNEQVTEERLADLAKPLQHPK